MHALGDGPQTFGAVEDRVETGHDRQKRLRGANVGSRLFAADMLLARLQR